MSEDRDAALLDKFAALLAERNRLAERVKELERDVAMLHDARAELARMRPVVEAAIRMRHKRITRLALENVVDAYKRGQKP
jgi:hypothetical protein